MTNDDYTTIKLPKELIEQIKKIIESNKYGFKTKSEFIKEAIREHLKYYKNANQQENA